MACPDVVADASATLELFWQWLPELQRRQLPVALVGQDGLISSMVPWDDISCLFIGGTTDWKLGSHAAGLVREAKVRGKLAHVGRVNSWKRIRYCHAIGADSVDGSSFSRFPRTYIPAALKLLEELHKEKRMSKTELTLAAAQAAANQFFDGLLVLIEYGRQETLKGLAAHHEPGVPAQVPSNVVPIRRGAKGPAVAPSKGDLEGKLQQSVDKGSEQLDAQIMKSIADGKLKLGDILIDMEMAEGKKPNKVVIRKHIKALVDAGKLKTEGEKKGMAYYNPEKYVPPADKAGQQAAATAAEETADEAKAQTPAKPRVTRRNKTENGDGLFNAWCPRMIIEHLESNDLSSDELIVALGNDARAAGKESPSKADIVGNLEKLMHSGKVNKGEDANGIFYQKAGVTAGKEEDDPAELPPA